MNIQGDGHIFKRFDNEMEHLHDLVLQMGELAVSQLNESVATLKSQDAEQAQRIIQRDSSLNALDIEADQEITRIIAKRQPMAKDLREIIAVGKIVAELERAGDEARKIAGLTIRFVQTDATAPGEKILGSIASLAQYVSEMLVLSMQAFDGLNLNTVSTVIEKGLGLDDQLQFVIRDLRTLIAEDSKNTDHFVDIVLGIRALERFGSHAKNIAGHIVFITEGLDVRHEGDELILEKIKRSQ